MNKIIIMTTKMTTKINIDNGDDCDDDDIQQKYVLSAKL